VMEPYHADVRIAGRDEVVGREPKGAWLRRKSPTARAATLARSRCRLSPSDAAWIGWGGRRQIVSVVSFYC
jgi:hypothetical protein